ncbi:MAG: fumarate hydratase [Erysipelotrichaceae bacterium]
MREYDVKELIPIISKMVQDISFAYPKDVYSKLMDAKNLEKNAIAKQTLELLEKNEAIAKDTRIPVCQDTGMVIVYINVGQDIHLVNGDLNSAINEGVAKGYNDGYLRKSVVSDPLFNRVNTKDNTPCIIYTNIVPGDKIELTLNAKGFGSENMSVIKMLPPSASLAGVKEVVLEAVKNAGPNACPPMVVGVGIGGSFDYCAVLAKKAISRSLDINNSDPLYAKLENELLLAINELDIGPQGLHGNTTALKVNIEQFPTHIASLPVGVNISCHITRHARIIL